MDGFDEAPLAGDAHVDARNDGAAPAADDECARLRARLAAAEERLAAVLDALPVGVAIADRDGRLVRDNAAHRELWGAAPATASWREYGGWVGYHPGSGARLAAHEWAMARALLRGEVVRGELVEAERFGGGGRRTFLNNAAPIRDATGAIVGAVVAELDVTERQALERDVRRNAERVQLALAAGAIVGTWDWELPTDRITVDERFAESFGLDPALGRTGLSLEQVIATVHPDDVAGLQAAIAEVIARGGAYRHPYRVRRHDGRYRWIEACGRVDHAPDGTPLRFPGVLIDVDDRRAAEARLREAEGRYRNLFEHMTEEVHFWQLVRDDAGRIVTWRLVDANAPVLATWGRALDEIRGRTTDEIFGAGATEHYRSVVERVFAEGAPVSYYDYFPALRRHFRFVTIPLGKGFITTGADVTAIREAQLTIERQNAALKEADRRKDDFLATLAHELRNPLAPVRNAARILRTADADAGARGWAAGVIERQIRHMALLLDDLLDVGRITSGKLTLAKRRVALAEVVDSAVETARPLLDARGHALTVTLPPEPPEFDADPLRLAQVLSNLLTNAAKYTDPGGHVELLARATRRELVLTVRDDGIGLAPETLEHVFERFSQVKGALERSEGGLGIGLSLVKGLVELHGGRVAAASGGLGYGSEFTVRLPLAPARAPEAPEVTTAAPGRRDGRVDGRLGGHASPAVP